MAKNSTGTLKYKKYKAKVTTKGGTQEMNWYGRAVQDRTIAFEDFITHMSEHNLPYSRGVIHGVLTDMLDCLQELVLDGKSVRLGDLGLFSVNIVSEPADTAEDWNPGLIKSVRLIVRNTKSWSNSELRKRCKFSELAEYAKEEAAGGGGNDTDVPGGV